MSLARTLLVVLATWLFLGLAGCQHESSPTGPGESAQAEPPKSAKLEIKDDTPDLLLTWVDEQGDFHVVQKPSQVPDAGRKQVRVVDTRREDGTTDWVYVANLTQKQADGTYSVETMPRAKWDEIGAERRKTRMEALAPSAPSAMPSAAPAPKDSAPPRSDRAAATALTAIVYGADWCKPCHAAEAYLKQRGVHVVMKDIDNSDAARAEMQKKLDRAGMGGAQIPIIDMMGQLLVGYSPAALDRAISTARKATTL
jgi:glutaredoxin